MVFPLRSFQDLLPRYFRSDSKLGMSYSAGRVCARLACSNKHLFDSVTVLVRTAVSHRRQTQQHQLHQQRSRSGQKPVAQTVVGSMEVSASRKHRTVEAVAHLQRTEHGCVLSKQPPEGPGPPSPPQTLLHYSPRVHNSELGAVLSPPRTFRPLYPSH